jgi:hypothetical protein
MLSSFVQSHCASVKHTRGQKANSNVIDNVHSALTPVLLIGGPLVEVVVRLVPSFKRGFHALRFGKLCKPRLRCTHSCRTNFIGDLDGTISKRDGKGDKSGDPVCHRYWMLNEQANQSKSTYK